MSSFYQEVNGINGVVASRSLSFGNSIETIIQTYRAEVSTSCIYSQVDLLPGTVFLLLVQFKCSTGQSNQVLVNLINTYLVGEDNDLVLGSLAGRLVKLVLIILVGFAVVIVILAVIARILGNFGSLVVLFVDVTIAIGIAPFLPCPVGIVGVLQVNIVGVTFSANVCFFIQSSSVLNNDHGVIGSTKVLHILTGEGKLAGSLVVYSNKMLGYFVVFCNRIQVNLVRTCIIGQAFRQSIAEHNLVLQVIRNGIAQSCLQLEGNIVADIVVSRVIPSLAVFAFIYIRSGRVVCYGIILVIDLFLDRRRAGLRICNSFAYNLNNVSGVDIILAIQRIVRILDQVVAGFLNIDNILSAFRCIVITCHCAQIQSNILRKCNCVSFNLQALCNSSCIAKLRLTGSSNAIAPNNVRQNQLIVFVGYEITGKNLICLVGMAGFCIINGNAISSGGCLIRGSGDGQAQNHHQCQSQCNDFFHK